MNNKSTCRWCAHKFWPRTEAPLLCSECNKPYPLGFPAVWRLSKKEVRTLADKVKELRQKHGWNQVTLAQKSDIIQATISRIESGKVTQPQLGQLQKLAEALGVTIDYLAGG
jgi:DNA-binding XRE family transcriptional regulator